MEEPDYIGSWHPSDNDIYFLINNVENQLTTTQIENCSSEHKILGPFELFIKKENDGRFREGDFEAECIDCYGKTRCAGNITPDRIIFTKQYDADAIKKGAASCPIKYDGLRKRIEVPFGLSKRIAEIVVGIITADTLKFKPKVFVMRRDEYPDF